MAILHRLLFFLVIGLLCAGTFALTLEFLGAGSYTQSEFFEEQVRRAQQGDVRAQYSLGHSYFNGEGVPKDYREAAKWLTELEENMTTAQIAEAQRLTREFKPKKQPTRKASEKYTG